ncbi:hypothetical protein [Haloterrigena turkmenica]|nr:hypothetical protein [Haloterrigena turkmenica]
MLEDRIGHLLPDAGVVLESVPIGVAQLIQRVIPLFVATETDGLISN